MKNIKSIFLAVAIAVLAAGCYNDFGTPEPQRIYTDEDMQGMGLQLVTIKVVKDKYIQVFGSLSNTGTNDNDNWATTKTLKFGNPLMEEDKHPGTSFWPEAANYYIKGKVISSDEEGNIYKSLNIFDGTAAIELKLHSDLFLPYHCNLATRESQWVYVRLKNLYLGNYRMMLSIGDPPSDALNTALTHKHYGNSNIENPARVARVVLPGETAELVAGTANTADIKIVNSANYTSLGQADLGRLIRFEGIKVRYAGGPASLQNSRHSNIKLWWVESIEDIRALKAEGYTNIDQVPEGDPRVKTNPALKNGNFDQQYPTWIVTDNYNPDFAPWYRWAYSDVNSNVRLYASVLMTFLSDATLAGTVYTSNKGVYTIRTSGYSRFAMAPIPRDGAIGNVTGIYGIYSKESDFSGGSRDYAQYQVAVSRFADLDFSESDLLSDEWIEFNTPKAAFDPPVKVSLGGGDDFE